MDYRSSSNSFLTRARLNRTNLTNNKPTIILWTLELCLIDPSAVASLADEKPWSDSALRPIHILLHDCLPSSLLSDIWLKKFADIPTDDQRELVAPALSSFPVSTNEVADSLNRWMLTLGDKLPYFYIDCIDSKTKRAIKHEVLASFTTLLETLTRDNFIVIEFPTIWVSQKELPS